ncbi:MAG: hypothetical protein ABW318_09575 [Vicinamibacterales bacterium]
MSKAIVGLISAIMVGAFPADAADPEHPDWPCVQRKVTELTATQMWDRGDVGDLTQWRGNETMQKLIAVLASRRVPLEQAVDAIARFADSQPPDKRDDALKQLFAGLLDAINRDRASVMAGIERFVQRQKGRAAEIERQGAVIRQLKERATGDDKTRAELPAAEERYNWDVRVFTERQHSLPLACEIPVLIEQRTFALGREIGARMSD